MVLAEAAAARFDDLVDGQALTFPPGDRVLIARRSDEVPHVLDEVDRATREGAWAYGFVAYEAASGLDPDLVHHPPVAGLPLAWFSIGRAPRTVPTIAAEPGGVNPAPMAWSAQWSADQHRSAVEQVRGRIAAGETYQCNLTTRMTGAGVEPADDLYRRLALAQRGRYNSFLDVGRFGIASASPELFFEIDGDTIVMRPMKGTAPRGRNSAEDAAATAALSASAKERAENVMIVDLVRNDLAILARPGTVTVTELFRAERYETVHQLTSRVSAQLRPDIGLTAIFRALFPCGSITGAPKARTMELIRDVEQDPRGVYCGTIGFVAPPGHTPRARFSVAIRTAVVDRALGITTYGTGGGITWSSTPDAEYRELLAKAAVLHVHPREFHLVETMRLSAGRIFCLERHLGRLERSAQYFGFSFDGAVDRAAARAVLSRATRHVGDAIVRLRWHRDGSNSVELDADGGRGILPVRLAVDPEPIDSDQSWPQHQTSLRLPYTTRLARHRDVDDVLIVNERGEITETCRANVVVRLQGAWWTPPVSSGCLPGICRERLLNLGLIHERVIEVADLRAAEGVALISAVRGWRPAVVIDHT